MKTASSPISGAAVKVLLMAIVSGVVLTTFAQSSSDDSTTQSSATPSPSAEAQTPAAAPPSRYISPFSMSAVPSFSYTNLTNFNPAIARSSLTINPFSRLPMNQEAAQPTPAPELPVFEPLPPPVYELSPGAFIKATVPAPLTAPEKVVVPPPAPATAISEIVPIVSEYFPDDYSYNFPPGAVLRRR